MRTRDSLRTLLAELDGDAGQLERIRAHNLRAWERIQRGARDYLDWGALALTLHTAYGVIENYLPAAHEAYAGKLRAIAAELA